MINNPEDSNTSEEEEGPSTSLSSDTISGDSTSAKYIYEEQPKLSQQLLSLNPEVLNTSEEDEELSTSNSSESRTNPEQMNMDSLKEEDAAAALQSSDSSTTFSSLGIRNDCNHPDFNLEQFNQKMENMNTSEEVEGLLRVPSKYKIIIATVLL